MTKDTVVDLRDPTVVAVEVTSIKGQMALLGQQVSQGLSNVSSQLSALQGDVREIERTVEKVATQQHELQTHSEGLQRAFTAIERLASRFDHWVEVHETENQLVADKVTGHSTGVRLVWIGLGVVATLAWAYVESRLGRIGDRLTDHITSGADAKAGIERRLDRAESEIGQLKTTRQAR